MAVCGGSWAGKPASSDCLVLNTTTVLGGLLGRIVRGVVTLDVGTYMVHAETSFFLPAGEREWVTGPKATQKVQCATRISADSYLAFGEKSVRQFDSISTGPTSDQGWVPEGVWPDLLTWRQRPGCATLGDFCLVAGGRNEWGETLKTVEIITLSSKSLGKASEMQRPRSHFNLVALGVTLIAISGYNDETSIEVWDGLDKPWRLASSKLNSSKRYISALTVDDRVCLEGPLPPHSCPTVDGGTCVFPFKNGIWAIFPQLITSSISGSESYSSCIEDQENRYWCSTTADVWAQCVTQKCPLGKVWTYVCHKYISASSVRFHLLTPSIEGNIVSNVLHRVCRGKSKSV